MEINNDLKEIAKLFLKLGTIAFGGPAAHIAMMEDEVVKKKKWMTQEHFLDLISATNLIPGPNSSEMAMHCGHERAGCKGLVVAGLSFILPAVLITSVFAWLYQQYGQLPNVTPFIYGIKPAVIAIIIGALVSLGKKALKNIELGILGVLTVIACLMGINEIIALLGCGGAGLILYYLKNIKATVNSFVPLALFVGVSGNVPVGSLKIFLLFLKIGALLYGSGYVLFAFLDAELVVSGYLTRQQLIDSIAVGQFTPGPVLSTATFIGWQLNKWSMGCYGGNYWNILTLFSVCNCIESGYSQTTQIETYGSLPQCCKYSFGRSYTSCLSRNGQRDIDRLAYNCYSCSKPACNFCF